MLPEPSSLIGLKSQDAKALVEAAGGVYRVMRRYQNPNDADAVEELWDDADWQSNRYNVALDRGNIVVDCNVR